MTITLNMPSELEDRVRNDAAREGVPTDAIIIRALKRAYAETLAEPPRPGVSDREIKLLDQVSLGLTDAEWHRYWELRSKFESDSLTAPEQTELGAVVDRVEAANARRMPHLIELANLRKISLAQLMDDLKLGNGNESGRAAQ